MIAPPAGTRIWIAAGVTDMRRGFNGLAALVQTQREADPFSGQIFAFRGRRGEALQRIAALYAIENEIRGQPPNLRKAVRQSRASPLLEHLHAWLNQALTQLSEK